MGNTRQETKRIAPHIRKYTYTSSGSSYYRISFQRKGVRRDLYVTCTESKRQENKIRRETSRAIGKLFISDSMEHFYSVIKELEQTIKTK